MTTNNQCLENSESKSYSINDNTGELTFRGWNIINPEKLVKEEIEDYFEEEITDFEITSKKEMAFSCSRYFEGDLASDDGFSFWIDYDLNWKRGLGKCTCFTFKFKKANNGFIIKEEKQ